LLYFGHDVTQRRLLRSARWRKAVATEKQKALVSKRWLKRDSLDGAASENERLSKIANMTKGEAANIIIRLKHGAQVTGFMSLLLHRILN
jgi:ATP-dependent helicase IRC3